MTAPLHPRWRRRKEARAPEIVEAALMVFAERGFAAARLEDVAARAGVSKGTLYLYFPNKQELFKAVVRSAILPNLELAERALAEETPGRMFAFLERLLKTLVSRFATTPIGAIPKLVIAEAGNFPDIARFYHREVIERGLALVSAVLARGIASGEFRPLAIAPTARLIMAPILMIALWRASFGAVEAGDPLEIDELLDAHLEALRLSCGVGRVDGREDKS